MCNDFGNHIPYSDYLAAFSQIRAPVVFPAAAPNLEPRDDIWPTETAPVFRRQEHGVELMQLRWGLRPARAKGAPVINFRSEGRRFPKGRCLIPASHFFEFTGRKAPKSKWKFTKTGEDWFCFAGLWRQMPDGAGDAFTILTTEPGPDVAPIHNRQVVARTRAAPTTAGREFEGRASPIAPRSLEADVATEHRPRAAAPALTEQSGDYARAAGLGGKATFPTCPSSPEGATPDTASVSALPMAAEGRRKIFFHEGLPLLGAEDHRMDVVVWARAGLERYAPGAAEGNGRPGPLPDDHLPLSPIFQHQRGR